MASSSWPRQEAEKILQARESSSSRGSKKEVVFACGYGPSGRPHIGTLGEMIRTSMVMEALKHLDSSLTTVLYAFVDDMDALRRIPERFQKKGILDKHLGKPLCAIPDPDDPSKSYAMVNVERLDRMVRLFDVSYTLKLASQSYREGMYDTYLKNVLAKHDAIVQTITPLLGKVKRAIYSPFLPVCPHKGTILEAKILQTDLKKSTILYEHPSTGEHLLTSILGGKCKLQWRVDWATRWQAYKVDYEMAGKDLISSMKVAETVSQLLGRKAPVTFIYELFNDEHGHKISKSVGNGLEVEEWLRYAPVESLKLFLFRNPKRAKKLYPQIIPTTTDAYDTLLKDYQGKSEEEQENDPLWYIHNGRVPKPLGDAIAFPLLLNLVVALGSNDTNLLKGMVQHRGYHASDERIAYACRYFEDHIKPTLKYKIPAGKDKKALRDLRDALKRLPDDVDAEAIQTLAFEVGKAHKYKPLRSWFSALYEMLLGQKSGPRFGSFVFFYGLERTVSQCEKILKRKASNVL